MRRGSVTTVTAAILFLSLPAFAQQQPDARIGERLARQWWTIIQMPYPRMPQIALTRDELEHVIAYIVSLKR